MPRIIMEIELTQSLSRSLPIALIPTFVLRRQKQAGVATFTLVLTLLLPALLRAQAEPNSPSGSLAPHWSDVALGSEYFEIARRQQFLVITDTYYDRADPETPITKAERSRLEALLEPTRIERHPVRGIWKVTLDRPVDGRDLAQTLEAEDFVRWISPEYSWNGDRRIATTGEFFVEFEAGSDIEATLEALELFRVRSYPTLARTQDREVILVRSLAVSVDVAKKIAALESQSSVRRAEPNLLFHIERFQVSNVPNDPDFEEQWGLANAGQQSSWTPGADVGALLAWDISLGADDIVIAIIDEGVDLSHPDLDQLVSGYDATNGPSISGPGSPTANEAHGTAVAGIALATRDNNQGVSGLAPNCRIMPIRVGYGSPFTTADWIVNSFLFATDNGADVLCNSWGNVPPLTVIQQAIEYAVTEGRDGLGCPVIFSAGNGGSVTYPGSDPLTIAVGASSPCDERKSFTSCDGETWWESSFGPEIDLVAPGVLIHSTDITGPGGFSGSNYVDDFRGTSAASPLVAAAAALLISVAPDLTGEEIRERLRETAADGVGIPAEDVPGFDAFMGYGRLDVPALLSTEIDVAPPSNFTCSESGSGVELSWQLPSVPYDAGLLLTRNGQYVALLPEGTASFSDTDAEAGQLQYELTGFTNDGTSPTSLCEILYVADSTDLVWAPVEMPGLIAGGSAIHEFLSDNGRVPLLIEDLEGVPDLSTFQTVWVNLGMSPFAYTPTVEEIGRFEDLLLDPLSDTAVYLEGGDIWSLPAAVDLRLLFGVVGADPGSADLSNLVATGECGVDFSTLSYVGENESVDRLDPLPSAAPLLEAEGADYVTSLFFSTPSYKTIAASHELGGLDLGGGETAKVLVGRYLSCLLGDSLPNQILAEDLVGLPGGTVTHTIRATTSRALEAFSFGLDYDPDLLSLMSLTVAGTAAEDASYVGTTHDPAQGFWTLGAVIDFFSPPNTPLETLNPGVNFPIASATYGIAPEASLGTASPLVIPAAIGTPSVETVFIADSATSYFPERRNGMLKVGTGQPSEFELPDLFIVPGESGSFSVTGSLADEAIGYWFGVAYSEEMLEVLELRLENSLGANAEYVDLTINDSWFTAIVFNDIAGPFETISPIGNATFLEVDFVVPGTAVVGQTTALSFEVVGSAQIAPTIFTENGNSIPNTSSGTLSVVAGSLFIRGDANGSDSAPDVGDVIAILEYLFSGNDLSCFDAADVNDTGTLDIADAIFLLEYLFSSQSPPPAPFPDLGPDPTEDSLGCDS